jgi:hypothetical protein
MQHWMMNMRWGLNMVQMQESIAVTMHAVQGVCFVDMDKPDTAAARASFEEGLQTKGLDHMNT